MLFSILSILIGCSKISTNESALNEHSINLCSNFIYRISCWTKNFSIQKGPFASSNFNFPAKIYLRSQLLLFVGSGCGTVGAIPEIRSSSPVMVIFVGCDENVLKRRKLRERGRVMANFKTLFLFHSLETDFFYFRVKL